MHIGDDNVGNLGWELRECHDTNANRRRAGAKVEILSSSTSANQKYPQALYQIETQLHSFVTWEKYDED